MFQLSILSVLLCALGACVVGAMFFRRVVSTNMVHIVQSRSKTTAYGTGQEAGNVYWSWPSWIPAVGVSVIALPVSNFDVSLKEYEAYDSDRVPFIVDVTAFFRITNVALAAQRVENMDQLLEQLFQIVRGAVRKVLAFDDLNKIMLERARFGTQFTEEVSEQLKEWGVESVKSMELMDIRDGEGSKVIHNIMAKKTSHIEMESRTEVANNKKTSEMAEIAAKQEVEVRSQEAQQAVGQRTALKEKEVGIALQVSRQEVLAQEKVTREFDMEVKRVEQVKQAEIKRDQEVVAANEKKQTSIIIAEGYLESSQREAQAIQTRGEAAAAAEKAMQLAPVEASIVLAKEIGENKSYQQYLVTIEAIKANMEVGKVQADALKQANVKIIANTGSPEEGANGVRSLFSSNGGTQFGAMLEGFKNTPIGGALMDQVTGTPRGIEDKRP